MGAVLSDSIPIDQLADAELDVLLGLCRLVIASDRVVSPEESRELRSLSEEIGRTRFAGAARRVQGVARPEDLDLLSVRPDARRPILEQVVRMAAADQVDGGEVELITWLKHRWPV